MKTSTDIAPASPNNDNEPDANAPMISAVTNNKKLNADTFKIILFETLIPQTVITSFPPIEIDLLGRSFDTSIK